MPKEEHIAVAPKQEDSNLAIVSMVLGVVSLTGPGLLLGIPAIVTASIALKKKLAGRGLAIAGLVTGIVSTVISILFCLFIMFLVMWSIAYPDGSRSSPGNYDNSSQQSGETPFDQSRT
jgi:hypothetical protein